MEVWKTINGYEGEYSVSTFGRIRNDHTGKVTRGRESGNGYKKFDFSGEHKVVGRAYVHRLVAEAFLEKGDGDIEVNHKDGNRANNNVDNLEWVSSSGNTEHAIVTGALAPYGKERKPIIAINVETGERKYFDSISKAETYYGTRHIDSVLSGKRRTAKGHTFVYAKGGDADVARFRAFDI